MPDSLRLSQLMISRLCHDLITPVGAVVSGFEVLDLAEPEERASLIQIIQQSAATASHRLSIYRAAFGYGSADVLRDVQKVTSLVESFTQSCKLTFHWDAQLSEGALTGEQDQLEWMRLFLNTLILVSEVAPFGGELRIALSAANGNLSASFALKGNLVELRPDVISGLKGYLAEDGYSPRNILAHLAFLRARELGATLDFHASNQEFFNLHLQGGRSLALAPITLF